MKNHTDGAVHPAPASHPRKDRPSAKEAKLAEALRRNLSRRKQAVAKGAEPGADGNG
jgi:hypothetical protein